MNIGSARAPLGAVLFGLVLAPFQQAAADVLFTAEVIGSVRDRAGTGDVIPGLENVTGTFAARFIEGETAVEINPETVGFQGIEISLELGGNSWRAGSLFNHFSEFGTDDHNLLMNYEILNAEDWIEFSTLGIIEPMYGNLFMEFGETTPP